MIYPVFNEAEALERVYDKEFIKELLKDFSEMKELNWDVFDAYIKQGDYAAMDLVSHTIKGTSGNLALTGIYQAATTLNDAIRLMDIAVITSFYSELKQEVERFREFLPGYLSN
jgi:hypothetical protein